MDAWYDHTHRPISPIGGTHLGSGEILQGFSNPDTLPGHISGMHPVNEFAKGAVFGVAFNVVGKLIAAKMRTRMFR